MKQSFRKISSVFLAFMVLLSTFSFTVDQHYCGDFLVDVSFLGEADDCGMKMNSSTKMKKGCCIEEQIHFEGQDELQQIVVDDISFEQQIFVSFHPFNHENNPILYSDKEIVFKEYSPPEIITDIHVLQEVFII